jgi:hypothetical protein
LSRVRRVLAAGSVSALILGAMAVPAFAFVHEKVPADECPDNTTAGANGTEGGKRSYQESRANAAAGAAG